MTKYVQVTLKRATKINACTPMKSRTIVYAKVSYENTIYTTTSVEDMGQNPVFQDDNTNLCHFAYENESDFITVELYNRNDACIGKSKLHFKELAKLLPEKEKSLPVLIDSGGYSKEFGELHFTAQIKEQQAWGEQGNLEVELKQGSIMGLTSIFGAKTTKMKAKLTYKHTTISSGTLEGTGNKFAWHTENKFTFIINSSKSDDVLGIKVYNKSTKVGECKIQMSLLMDNARSVVKQTADLLIKNKSVGSIEVVATFTNASFGHQNPYTTRPSHPKRHARAQKPPPASNGYTEHGFHGSTSFVPQPAHNGYAPSQAHYAQNGYPPSPAHYAQPRHIPSPAQGPYEPSAPMYPPSGVPHPQEREAHGAPAGMQEKKTHFQDHPEILNYVNTFHW